MLFRSFAARSVLLLLCFSVPAGKALAAAGNALALFPAICFCMEENAGATPSASPIMPVMQIGLI